jgi:hypothetical protein
MIMYKLCPNNPITNLPSNVIIRLSDNANIPMDEANVDYQQYLKWIAEGNVAQPAENN